MAQKKNAAEAAKKLQDFEGIKFANEIPGPEKKAEDVQKEGTLSENAGTAFNGKDEKQTANNGMIYDVRFSTFPKDSAVKGICSVTLGGQFAVKGVKVIEGNKGLFVAMPTYKAGNEYKDVVYPITREGRIGLNNAVLTEFQKQSQSFTDTENQGIDFDIADMFGAEGSMNLDGNTNGQMNSGTNAGGQMNSGGADGENGVEWIDNFDQGTAAPVMV